MFVFGVVVGMALALLVTVLLTTYTQVPPDLVVVALGLLAIFFLFSGFLQLELKLGVLAGGVVGGLLGLTPFAMPDGEAASDGGTS